MEFAQKYWWLIGGGIVVLFLLTRSRGSTGPTLAQVGGPDLGYAQLDSQTALSERQQNYDFVSNLLNYGLELERTGRADEIERLRIASGEKIAIKQAETGYQAQANALNAAQAQANLQYQAQLAAIRAQQSQANTTNWLNAIFGGWDRLSPLIFGDDDGGFGGDWNIWGGNPGWNPGGGFTFGW